MARLLSLLALTGALVTPALAGDHDLRFLAGPEQSFDHLPVATGRARLGVGVTPLTEELQAHFGASPGEGVLVSKVVEDSPAADAGLQVGDVIVGLGETRISNGMVLRQAVLESAGGTVQVEVLRGGKTRRLDAKLPELGPDEHVVSESFEIPGGQGRVWVYGDGGRDVQIDIEGLRDQLRGGFADRLQPLPLPDGEFDDLHLRIDDLEQQLLEMTERLNQATDRIEDRLEHLER